MSIKLLGCMILASLGASVASAADPSESPGIIVTYGDLDLTRPSGQAVLNRRIARAVERLCPTSVPFVPREVVEATECRRDASDRANEAVHAAVAQAQQRALASRTQLAAH
jgi:UrcA family protein